MSSAWRLAPILLLTGCNEAPSQNILGSFFPAWMLCAALGIGAAAACRAALGALSLSHDIRAPALGYLGIATAVTLFAWLLRFGQ